MESQASSQDGAACRAASPSQSPTHAHHASNPALKGAWAAEEDAMLLSAIETNGSQKWSHIASHLPGRTGKQCRERWHNQLNPAIDKSPWTENEDRIILSEYARAGPRWADIAAVLTGRTDNAVKNRWNCSMRRKIEQFIAEEVALGANAAVDADGAVPLLLDHDRLERAVQRVRKLPSHAVKKRAAPPEAPLPQDARIDAYPPRPQQPQASQPPPKKRAVTDARLVAADTAPLAAAPHATPADADTDTAAVRPQASKGAAASGAAPPGSSDSDRENRPCYCRASRCLKLYCDCFAAGMTCDGCCCIGCQNNDLHREARQEAMATVLKKNPAAFDQKILSGGCNCKRSRCLKKYCECFEAHVRCGISCACESCENFEGSTKISGELHAAQSADPTNEILDAARGMSMLIARNGPARVPPRAVGDSDDDDPGGAAAVSQEDRKAPQGKDADAATVGKDPRKAGADTLELLSSLMASRDAFIEAH